MLFTHAAVARQLSAEAIQQVQAAGFPVPVHPARYVPSLDELRFINKGLAPAATEFRMMCQRAIDMSSTTMLPADVEEATE